MSRCRAEQLHRHGSIALVTGQSEQAGGGQAGLGAGLIVAHLRRNGIRGT